MQSRVLARAIAFWHGWFWLPCEICGQNFAGFESGAEPLMYSHGFGRLQCSKPECVAEVKRRNAATGFRTMTNHNHGE